MFLPLLRPGCHTLVGYLRPGVAGRKLSPKFLTELNGLEPTVDHLLKSWHWKEERMYGKGLAQSARAINLGKWRAAKGLLGWHCLWARLADHLEPGAKAKRSSTSSVPLNPRWRTQANCLGLWSVAETGGLPVQFLWNCLFLSPYYVQKTEPRASTLPAFQKYFWNNEFLLASSLEKVRSGARLLTPCELRFIFWKVGIIMVIFFFFLEGFGIRTKWRALG